MTDKVRKACGVNAVSQATGWRYEINIGRASEGGVDTGLIRKADTDECVASWPVRCKLSGRVRVTRKYRARELIDTKVEPR